VRITTVFRRAAAILLDIALIGLVAVVVLTAAVGPVAALSGRTTFVIGGGSMAPAVPRGAIVLVDPAAAAAVEPGDVATFRTPQNVLVTHRVLRVIVRADGIWYETKGDSNAFPDPALWPAKSVVGPVVAAVPGLGFMSWLFRHPVGWLNVALLAGWLLLARHLVHEPQGDPVGLSDRPDRRRSRIRDGADAGSLAPGA
jgi:signal peptidase I